MRMFKSWAVLLGRLFGSKGDDFKALLVADLGLKR